MFNIGCHLSLSKGYEAMGQEALSINANTFQFFTRNPRGGSAKEIDKKDAEKLRALITENHFAPILAHAPYTLNLCSADARTREFGMQMMTDDLERLHQLPCRLYNFHPGSHVGQGIEEGIRLITDALNRIIKPEQEVIILLETMSGKGSEVGGTFGQIQQIIEGIHLKEKIGVCMDSCHIYDAGYDIVNDLGGVLNEFDKIIGLQRLYAVHLNDTKNPMGSHKDRHEEIGKGAIGLDGMKRIINHPKLRNLPFYLETPVDTEEHGKEIKLLRSLYSE